jgi:hydrogenase maturation protease
MSRLAIIGIGNPLRGDDGVGPAVVELLRGTAPISLDMPRVTVSPDVETALGTVSPDVEMLCRGAPDGFELLALSGEATGLADALTALDAAVVVDCARGRDAAGTIRRFTLPGDLMPPETSATSSHAGGLELALRLLATLGRMPLRVTVFTVTGANFEAGAPMSAAVAAAARLLARSAEDEIAQMAEELAPHA